jgi:hypothetical protein
MPSEPPIERIGQGTNKTDIGVIKEEFSDIKSNENLV